MYVAELTPFAFFSFFLLCAILGVFLLVDGMTHTHQKNTKAVLSLSLLKAIGIEIALFFDYLFSYI